MSKTNLIGRQIIVVDVNMHGGDGSIAKFFEIKDDELYENINEERFYGEQNRLDYIYEKVINKVYFERNPIIFIDEPKAHILAKKIKDTYLGLIEVVSVEIPMEEPDDYYNTLRKFSLQQLYNVKKVKIHKSVKENSNSLFGLNYELPPSLLEKSKKKGKLK